MLRAEAERGREGARASPADIDQEAIELGHLELCWEASHGIELLFAAVSAQCFGSI